MKTGFVAILGRPNTGKSTLLNKILNFKVSITSSTPQTTRDQVKGIYNDEDSQIVFIDTPGIHKPKQKLGDSLNEASYSSMKDADLILFLQPIDELVGPGDKMIIEKIKSDKKIALITKLDKGDPEQAKERASELKELGFKDVLGTSKDINQSIEHLLKFIKDKLPEGEPYYDREEITDVSMRFIAKEIIRESTIELTEEEIPHSIGVLIDDFKEPESEDDLFEINSTIFVERNSQKGIIIGKDGKMIKNISTNSRKKLEEVFDHKVFLRTRVKVNKNWTEDIKQIKKMGY